MVGQNGTLGVQCFNAQTLIDPIAEHSESTQPQTQFKKQLKRQQETSSDPNKRVKTHLRNSSLEDAGGYKPADTRDLDIPAPSLLSRSWTFSGVISPRPMAPVHPSRTPPPFESFSSTSTESCEANITMENEDRSEHDYIKVTTRPPVESWMATKRALSSPSVRALSPTPSPAAAARQSSLSLSLGHTEAATLGHLNSEDNKHSLKNSPYKESTKLHSSRLESSKRRSIPARGMILRRHQTMISSPSEFMRSFELDSKPRITDFRSSIDRKSIVFAQDNYVPNPSREDCQMLPCAYFVPKPDDTTKRITPQTVGVRAPTWATTWGTPIIILTWVHLSKSITI